MTVDQVLHELLHNRSVVVPTETAGLLRGQLERHSKTPIRVMVIPSRIAKTSTLTRMA